MPGKVTLGDKFAQFSEQWAPRIVARYEGHEIRIARLGGDFIWHKHEHDELFLCLEGTLDVEFRDRTEVLGAGDLLLIETGEEHRPLVREGEVKLLVINPAGAPNTGDPATATQAVEA